MTAIALITGVSGAMGRHWSQMQMESARLASTRWRGHDEPVDKLPVSFRSGQGWENLIWRRLPAILLRARCYRVLLLHWTLVLTVAWGASSSG